MAKRYDTDLTDSQWAWLEPLLPAPARTGRPRADLREVVNAILYLNRSGKCKSSRPTVSSLVAAGPAVGSGGREHERSGEACRESSG